MNSIFIKKYWFLWNSIAASLIIMMIATSFTLNNVPGAANGTLKIRFINTANGKTNPFDKNKLVFKTIVLSKTPIPNAMAEATLSDGSTKASKTPTMSSINNS